MGLIELDRQAAEDRFCFKHRESLAVMQAFLFSMLYPGESLKRERMMKMMMHVFEAKSGRKMMGLFTRKAAWGLAAALLAVMLTSSAVFAEGDAPEEGEPSAQVEVVNEADPAAENYEPSGDIQPLEGVDAPVNNEGESIPEAAPADEPVSETDAREVNPTEAEDVILVDETGEALDMASQTSADAIAGGDPWWISGGVKYAVVFTSQSCPLGTSVDSGTCWKVDNNAITTALEKIDELNLLPSDGMIVVENGDYEEDVVVDGLSGNMVLKNLKGILGMGSNMVNLSGSITISNTIAGFSLKGFNITDGGVAFQNNTGALVLNDLYITNPNGDGLVVENHNGTVELTNVQSRNNKGDGGRIDNSASLNSAVKVTNSAFDFNDDGVDSTWNSGLKITTNGPVTLEGVAASRNNGNGTEIYGFSQLTISNSLFDRNNPAPYPDSEDYGYGLYAESARPANVQITNVFAYFNDNHGFEIHTAGYIKMDYVRGSHSSIRTGKIDADGETVIERLNEDNKYIGDRWYFNGSSGQELDITLTSYVFDAYLELYDASTDSLLAFNDNMDGTTTNSLIEYTLSADGLYYIVARILESSGGVDGKYILSLNDPGLSNTTEYNRKGALLDNTTGSQYVKITNAMFQDNVGDGLEINTLNTIYLTTVDASHNSMRGALLDNCQYDETTALCRGFGKIIVLSLANDGWYGGNYFLDNGSTGLEVISKGAITLTNVGAYDNLGSGIILRNDYSTAAVLINTNVTNFTNVFRNNGADGLKIISQGAVRIDRAEANYNKNYGYHITTKGAVTLKDLTGSGNGYNGLYVNNQVSGSSAIVSLISSRNIRNAFKENGIQEPGVYPGVDIRSYGNISIQNTDALLNYAAGIHLTNRDAPAARTITIVDVNTSENQGSGLLAYAMGNIVVKGLTSSRNSLVGSDIVYAGETVYERLTSNSTYDYWWFTAPADGHVNIILQSKEFNAYLELYDANGNLIAGDDDGYEDFDAQIEMDLPAAGAYYIHVRSANLNKGNYTLSINDPGNIYPPTYFYFYGALLDNSSGSGSVTINPTAGTPFNTFNDNNYRGIEVRSKGKIITNNLTATDNGNTGAYLYNPNGTGTITVYTNDKNSPGAFDGNSSWGIYAISSRNIILKNISANLNGDAGAYLNNCLVSSDVCSGAGSVTLTSAYGLVNTFSSNQKFGLWISTGGTVNITDIHADANGLGGLYIKNAYTGTSGNVTLKASKNVTNTFLTNVWASPSYLAGVMDPRFYGLEINSNGNVAISAVEVKTTYGTGALIQNQEAALPKNIVVQDGSFDANQGYGLIALSKGAINLYGVNAHYNSLVSGAIDLWGETVYEHLTPNVGADVWWFDGYEDDEVDVILTSDEFDVILEVFDKNNNLIAADDDSYTGTNARVTFNLPANGEYYIKVRPQGAGDGNYVLSLNDEFMNWGSTINHEYSGVYLDNSYGSMGVTIKSTPKNESPNYYHNNKDGLTIKSAGAVTLSNVYAMQNGADGANVINHAGTGSVTINTSSSNLTSSFSYNSKYGLYVQSRGKVIVANKGRMYLRDNGYTGAFIDNTTLFAPEVSISRVEVNNNIMKGVEIYSRGNVTLNNILAINNLENGVFVDNCDWDSDQGVCLGVGKVSLIGTLGANNISDNGATGLAVYSNGSILVDKLFAIQNGGRGMVLDNATSGWSVTVTNTIARLNQWHGVHIETRGFVSVKYLHSMSNGMGNDGDGLYLRTAAPGLAIFQKSSFLGNEGSGIDIAYDTVGYASLINVSYFGNDTDLDGDLNYYLHPYIP